MRQRYQPEVSLDLSNKQKKQVTQSILFIIGWTVQSLAIERVKIRVAEGGHYIPTETIIRRYFAGLKNFIDLYKDKVDYWMLIDNSKTEPELIAEGRKEEQLQVQNLEKWEIINKFKNDTKRN